MITNTKNKILSINLNNQDELSSSEIIHADRDNAIKDLIKDSYFLPKNDTDGPYTLELYIEDNKLIFHITNSLSQDLPFLVLSLTPYRRIIKDYFLIVQSYTDALRDGKPSRLEAIDMGRRGLHNEGAELLRERLKDKITIDTDTARRLFTLICVLHHGKTHAQR